MPRIQRALLSVTDKTGILDFGLRLVELRVGLVLTGGPTMIRSAAKNFQDVAVVTSPDDYRAISDEMRENGGCLTRETHWRLAQKAFRTTADYDGAISVRLAQVDGDGPLAARLSIS